MERRDSFILYASQYEALKSLSFAELGELFDAIFRWLNGTEGVEGGLSPSLLLAFRFLTLQIRMDRSKYEKRLLQTAERMRKYREGKKRRETGNRGGVTRVTQVTQDDNDNENENENENGFSKDGNKEKSKSGKAAIDIKEAAWQQNFIKKTNEVFEAEGCRIPPLRKLTAKRIAALQRLWEQFDGRQIAECFRKAANSSFLNGRGAKNTFQATFDWLIVPENFLKVLEGNYR